MIMTVVVRCQYYCIHKKSSLEEGALVTTMESLVVLWQLNRRHHGYYWLKMMALTTETTCWMTLFPSGRDMLVDGFCEMFVSSWWK